MTSPHSPSHPVHPPPDTSNLPTAYLTRTATFSAAHRLHNPSLPATVNSRIFSKCNHPNYHGHNYTLSVTVRGKICPITGMVLDLAILKKVISSIVDRYLDHKNIDLDIPYFKSRVSTTENLAVWIWDMLKEALEVEMKKEHEDLGKIRMLAELPALGESLEEKRKEIRKQEAYAAIPSAMEREVRLCEVAIDETDKNKMTYRGE